VVKPSHDCQGSQQVRFPHTLPVQLVCDCLCTWSRLIWHCHDEEVGPILWELHSSLQHARGLLMYNALAKHRMGSTSFAGNITVRMCHLFCTCCPCTALYHDVRQRTVQSIKSSQCMERLQADCITIKWRAK
jgi:hypothetical protein